MKCKKCGTLVQMKRKAAPPSPAASETAVAPPAPTAVAPAYEPNYDSPAPPAYSYAAPVPSPEPPALPYGYPSPYPTPPGYGYPQPPGYSYPVPVYNYAAPPPAPESVFPTNDELGGPPRAYQRGSGGGLQKIVLIAIILVLGAGLVAIGMRLGQSHDGGSQAKNGDPKAGTPKPPDGTTPINGNTPSVA